MRQLQYGAGGFSYKFIRTSQELYPLIICGCKFLDYKKEQENHYMVTSSGKKAHKWVHSVHHLAVTATNRNIHLHIMWLESH